MQQPFSLVGSFNTTGNPSSVPGTQSQVGKVQTGDRLTFGSQPGIYYSVTFVSAAAVSIMPPFSGLGSAADACIDVFQSGGWGPSPNGFNIKPQAQIQQDIVNSVIAQTGQAIDNSPNNPFGQAIGAFSGALAELWQAAAQCDEGIDRDNAEGAQLDNVGTLTGTLREAPATSQVTCSVVLAAGTYQAGALSAAVASPPSGSPVPSPVPSSGAQFKNANPVTSAGPVALAGKFTTASGQSVIPSTIAQTGPVSVGDLVAFGSQSGVNYRVMGVSPTALTIYPPFSATGSGTDTAVDLSTSGVLFTAVNTGPVTAPAGYLSTIAAPVVGWSDVYNGSSAAPGVPLQDDADYRVTQTAELTDAGGSTLQSLQAALVTLFASAGFGLTGCSSNVVDSPLTGTFAVYVYAGTEINFSASQLTAIGQTILANKPAGIQPTGSNTVTVFDSQGIERVVPYTPVSVLAIYVILTVAFTPMVAIAGTQGSVAGNIKSVLVGQSQGFNPSGDLLAPGSQGVLVPGGSCFASPIASAAVKVQGVGSVRSILLGFSNPPTLSRDLWGANDAAIQAQIDPTNAVAIGLPFVGGIATGNIQIVDAQTGQTYP